MRRGILTVLLAVLLLLLGAPPMAAQPAPVWTATIMNDPTMDCRTFTAGVVACTNPLAVARVVVYRVTDATGATRAIVTQTFTLDQSWQEIRPSIQHDVHMRQYAPPVTPSSPITTGEIIRR